MEPSSIASDASALPPSAHSGVPPPQASFLTANSPTLLNPVFSRSTPADVSSAHSIQPQPRSCITCRRRKVRCNKIHPCSNCNKANIDCVFPGPGRAPRKPKNRPDSELLARLRRLEGVVKSLGAEVKVDDQLDFKPNLSSQGGEAKNLKRFSHQVDTDLLKHPDPRNLAQREVEQEFGRLVIGDGKSRYVSNRFWARLGDEVEEMRDILGASSDEEEDYSSPESHGLRSTHPQNHDGFLFGFSSLAQSLREIHPSPDQMLILWDIYLENVAPLLPIFHKPTLRKCFFRASDSLVSLNKNTEAAMFSVYYAAITSMNSSQCLSLLGEDRHIMLSRSRVAMEQAMARANLLSSQSIVLLQSVVLFLLCVRRQDDSRYAWSMVAIVIRLAQGLGVHRDGSTFALQPFETEMRRRLWWNICLLDFQVAEDHGCDPFIYEPFYDTRIPLNINDDDICQESTETPEERVECTESTFSLIRCEIVAAARRLSYIAPSSACSKTSTDISLEHREELILELSKRLEERYVQHCAMTTPILWACATISRLAISRLWLTIHQPMSRLGGKGMAFANDKHHRLFLTSIEVLEFSCLLQTNENTMKWSWLFRTHMQWNSIAFLLSELCVRPICPVVDRAWNAVNSVYEIWNLHERKGTVWRAINKLMTRAVKFREIRLQQLETQFGRKGGGVYDGRTLGSIDDPLHTRAKGRSQYISPTLQAQGGINKASDFPSGINMELNEMFYSPSDIQMSTTSIQQSIQPPLTPVPFSGGGDVVSHSSTVGIPPWLQPSPQGNDSMSLVPDCTSLSSVHEPSWDDWDEVVREFQRDIAEGVETDNTHDRDWFE
ncbi:hypothetical protein EMCG_00785 [[Emmonsia] crescens]|uniref:C6 finger domain transcription factor nscR n=1 Tax=[Emmonsia] crescens TaxID=73230 RepID=A0A0G2IXY3_9EURO|nr:hypothetical protein EMCG_00785 [Emmonsia crescens UAMH 3008]